MSSRLGGRSSPISPVLFLTVDGEPMRFFLRPGPTKVHLQPIIKAGGGLVCRAQEPGAFLLIDPEEMGSVAGSAAHWYVSTQYIRDCMEENQQLEVEDYRFKPDNVKVNVQTRSEKQSVGNRGRMCYTLKEDKAIMTYICEHKRESRGNRVWQEMAKKGLTCHSWQSMRDRYLKQLIHRQPEPRDSRGRNKTVATAALEENGGNSSEKEREKDIPIQTSSLQKDSPQPDIITPLAQESDASKTSSESQLPQASSSSSSDTGLQLPQMSPQKDQAQCCPEGPGTEESTVEPERDPLPQLEPPVDPAQSDTTTPQRVPSKRLHQPSPPGGKHTHPQTEEAAAIPSLKRARLNSGAVTEVLAKKDSAVTSGEKATTSNMTEGQLGKKKANKRKLGILESAVREFEGSDESGDEDDDETPDLAEIVGLPPAPVPGPGRETQTPVAAPQTENTSAQIQPQPAAQEKSSKTQPEGQLPDASGPAMSGSAPNAPTVPNAPATSSHVPKDPAIPATSTVPHLFLFERDSQQAEEEEPSQPFTQLQLQEAKQLVLSLMRESKLGLVAVTKALLKNSGDVSAALRDPLMMPNGTEFGRALDGNVMTTACCCQLILRNSRKSLGKRAWPRGWRSSMQSDTGGSIVCDGVLFRTNHRTFPPPKK
ncbi:telomeric repeat-binding factor 2-interacting protein 1 isoform X1 [Salvelinus fontinalis]|uniref:telomeric repeat-binding factor 2-interacting protein 1 isoform X1 n=1 Tax=Salvelinus fontinalis TaxID=8038 RepID=UPI0024862374|nr:telomeric repeat-binding factor 2-interacting protein 1 isoform X1 [Salvelinus fontinalis]